MIATLFLFAFMLVATITDIWRQKIYNWTTYTGTIVAFVLAGFKSVFDRTDIASVGIVQSLIGFLVCGGIMLLCLVLFRIGGGDMKLLTMVGAFLGPELGIETLLWAFVIGAACAIIILIWSLGAINLVRRVCQQLMFKFSLGEWGPRTEEEDRQLKLNLYLAPSCFMALVIVQFSLVEHIVR